MNDNFTLPEFPTLYFCPFEAILQAADYRVNFKIQSEIGSLLFRIYDLSIFI